MVVVALAVPYLLSTIPCFTLTSDISQHDTLWHAKE